MALSLTEASKLSNDMLLQGVVETIVKDSPVLQYMPFIEITGNGLTYMVKTPCPTSISTMSAIPGMSRHPPSRRSRRT
jgi:hypothetical protein